MAKIVYTPLVIVVILTVGVLPTYHAATTAPSFVAPGAKPAPSLFLDGSAANGCPNTTSSCTATLTTSHANDVIVAFATEILDQQTSCVFSISDTANLTWKARSGIVFGEGGRAQLQEFWTVSQSPLSMDSVTESIAGCGNNYNNIMVFAVGNANNNAPFDPNARLPGTASGFGGDSTVQISTTNRNDFVFGGLLHGNFPPFPTAGPGFTIITPPGTNAVEYQIVNKKLTSFPVTFLDGAQGDWLTIGDAIQSN